MCISFYYCRLSKCEMSVTNNNYQNEIECVLISDEEEDDVREKTSATTKPVVSQTIESNRMSRRRKNRNENVDDTKNNEQFRGAGRSNGNGNGNDHTNDTYKSNATVSSANWDKKYGNADNRETRSRKRERSPSPQQNDVKENDPIPYKEILSGLEGAAFQSRYGHTLR